MELYKGNDFLLVARTRFRKMLIMIGLNYMLDQDSITLILSPLSAIEED
jgi:hypothetical protein